jgi:lactoylglutathione lyase
MDLTKLDINDIAQNIDMGMLCFIHRETLELISYPDPNQFHDDVEEHWGEDMKKVARNEDEYVCISKMGSSNSFRIMEDYTKTIKNKKLQGKLEQALENRKPFRNWKYIIDDQGEEREEWFKFKQARMETWVKCHLDPQEKYDPETLYELETDEPEPIIFGLRTTIYTVNDLEKAKNWYSAAFNISPYFESEDYLGFNINDFELGLQLSDIKPESKVERAISYWAVDGIERAMEDMNIVGAKVHQPITKVGRGIKRASIIDPWNNIIGLIYNPNF